MLIQFSPNVVKAAKKNGFMIDANHKHLKWCCKELKNSKKPFFTLLYPNFEEKHFLENLNYFIKKMEKTPSFSKSTNPEKSLIKVINMFIDAHREKHGEYGYIKPMQFVKLNTVNNGFIVRADYLQSSNKEADSVNFNTVPETNQDSFLIFFPKKDANIFALNAKRLRYIPGKRIEIPGCVEEMRFQKKGSFYDISSIIDYNKEGKPKEPIEKKMGGYPKELTKQKINEYKKSTYDLIDQLFSHAKENGLSGVRLTRRKIEFKDGTTYFETNKKFMSTFIKVAKKYKCTIYGGHADFHIQAGFVLNAKKLDN